MSLKTFLWLIFSFSLTGAGIYGYSLIDPRLDIILEKNQEIMRLDNKIAELTDENKKINDEQSDLQSVIKTSENSTGKINDEYKLCLRKLKRSERKKQSLSSQYKVLEQKHKVLLEYAQVKNEVTSLQEQIKALRSQQGSLEEEVTFLGGKPGVEQHNSEVVPAELNESTEDSPITNTPPTVE